MSASMPIIVDTEQTRKDNLLMDLKLIESLIKADVEVEKFELPFKCLWTKPEFAKAALNVLNNCFGEPYEVVECNGYAHLSYLKTDSENSCITERLTETFRLFISIEREAQTVLHHESADSLVQRLELLTSSKEK
tara:strand:+ start:383 stop:787 length:405 start_codon:yes stop_codon:yes gene_type:complete